MGTRSMIGRLNADGTVDGIYCHWDGYIENNGKLLQEHYLDPAKIDALIALGDLSSLDVEIGEKHDFNARIEGQCNAYGRDRGEDNTESKRFESADEFWASRDNWGAEYQYLFDGQIWLVKKYNGVVRPLKDALLELPAE